MQKLRVLTDQKTRGVGNKFIETDSNMKRHTLRMKP